MIGSRAAGLSFRAHLDPGSKHLLSTCVRAARTGALCLDLSADSSAGSRRLLAVLGLAMAVRISRNGCGIHREGQVR